MPITRVSRTKIVEPLGGFGPPIPAPSATFLQIQGSGQTSPRTLELPLGPIRIGSGARCEVQLLDPGLGEVQCMIRRRGETWHLQPIGPPGFLWFEGRATDQQFPLPLGVPFQVGSHWLTLRSAEDAFNDWGSFESPITVEPEAAPTETSAAPDPEPGVEPGRPAAPPGEKEERLRRWEARLEQRERWLKDRQEERRWEARWKSAGESIRARPTTPSTPPASAESRRPPEPSSSGVPVRPIQTPPVARIIEARVNQPLRRPLGPVAHPEPRRVPLPPRTPSAEPVRKPSEPISRRPADPKPKPAPQSRSVVILPSTVQPQATPTPTPTVAEVQPAFGPTVEKLPPAREVARPVDQPTAPEELAETVAVAPAVGADLVEGSDWEAELPALVENLETSAEVEIAGPLVESSARAGDPSGRDWPSARAIFASQGVRQEPCVESCTSTPKRRGKLAPRPTDLLGPACWTMPLWLGWFPTLVAALAIGLGSTSLAYAWAVASSDANRALRVALLPEGTTVESFDLSAIPRGGWWVSNPTHQAAWALALLRVADGEDHSEAIRSLTTAARSGSQLAARARFVVEWPESAEPEASADLSHLGRSRDVVTLVWTGRRLRKAGKIEASLRAFRSALEIASRASLADLDPPSFDDDPQVRRYALPREALVGLVARAMIQSGVWTVDQWTEALPASSTASLAASRALAKVGKRLEADRLADLAIRQAEAPGSSGFDPAEELAAGAEALASRGRWTDAAEQYRQAIDRVDDDSTRRRWWLNLAEIAPRANDDAGRLRALEAAKAPDAVDEITPARLEISARAFGADRELSKTLNPIERKSDPESFPPNDTTDPIPGAEAMATVDLPHERTPSPDRQSPPLVALFRDGWNDPSTRLLELGALAALALLTVIFSQNLQHFVLVWSTDENYSHGFLVPLISLYFANEAARKGPIAIRSGLGIGSSLLVVAIAIKLATILIPFPVASDYGFLFALAGVCALLAGRRALKRYWFAFFFLVFMVPLPVALYTLIANPLQLMVSQVATSMLNVIGIPSLCEGNMITLAGGKQLFVAEACSGMRQLTGFLALTTAWAYLTDRPGWNRLLLVGSSIPIAMTANVVRVTLTGVITYSFDPKYASGAFHTIEGLAMMGLGLLMLSTFSWTLDQIARWVPGPTVSTEPVPA